MNPEEQVFLLQNYGEEYGPDCGPWNTSVKSKYLEYKIAAFFEEHFEIPRNASVCNIGIGAGYWDKYLSYRLNGGRLTSIDREADICRKLALCLKNECNPNPIQIIQSDVLLVDGLENSFDLVTMIGSTRLDSGVYEPILSKAIKFVKSGGAFFYQTLDPQEETETFATLCQTKGMKLETALLDEKYGYQARYFKAVKE